MQGRKQGDEGRREKLFKVVRFTSCKNKARWSCWQRLGAEGSIFRATWWPAWGKTKPRMHLPPGCHSVSFLTFKEAKRDF